MHQTVNQPVYYTVRLSSCMSFFTNSICIILCDSQLTPRSTSTRLELGECLSISLFSTPLLLLLQSPLVFFLSTHSPSPLSQHLRSIPDNLPSASACPPLLLPIILSIQTPPLPRPFLFLCLPEHLSSMAVQDLLCRICPHLHRAESQVHSMTQTPG